MQLEAIPDAHEDRQVMDSVFLNRAEAGRRLAESLHPYRGRPNVIVLGLPRGGVPVAFEAAQSLQLPLDVFVVRKLGVPGYEELGMGAIASGNVSVLNQDVLRSLTNPEENLERVMAQERIELERREAQYRQGQAFPVLRDRTVILVDDGVATGATMRAAAVALKKHGVAKIVVAVPVGALETCRELSFQVDEIVCLITPPSFHGVGQFYEDFSQTTDQEVQELLAKSRDRNSDETSGNQPN